MFSLSCAHLELKKFGVTEGKRAFAGGFQGRGMPGRGAPFGSFGMSGGLDGSGPMMMEMGAASHLLQHTRSLAVEQQGQILGCPHPEIWVLHYARCNTLHHWEFNSEGRFVKTTILFVRRHGSLGAAWRPIQYTASFAVQWQGTISKCQHPILSKAWGFGAA